MATIVNPYRYAAGCGGGGGELPDHNWDIVLDASVGVYNNAGTTLATDGQTVQEWHDQSGNNNDGKQSSISRRPQLDTSLYGGAGGLSFSNGVVGYNNYLNLTSAITLPGNGYTAFFVCTRKSEDNWSVALGGEFGSATYNLVNVGDTWYGTRAGGNFSITGPQTGDMIMTVQNDNNTNYTFRHNGTDLGTASTASAATGNALRIGARDTSESHSDAIAQILHTADILTTGEMKEVECYLSAKWGIAI